MMAQSDEEQNLHQGEHSTALTRTGSRAEQGRHTHLTGCSVPVCVRKNIPTLQQIWKK